MKISASSLNLFFRCPFAFSLKLEGKEPVGASDALYVGKSVHRALELYFKMQDENVKLEDFTDQAMAEIEHNYNTAEKINIKDKIQNKLVAYSEIAKSLLPNVAETESEFRIEFGEIEIHGFIDLITKDHTIIDFKTTDKAPSKPSNDYILQLSIYNLTGIGDKFQLHYLTDKKALVFDVNPIPSLTMLDILHQVKDAIELGVFPPSGMSHPYGCAYCSYRTHCKYTLG